MTDRIAVLGAGQMGNGIAHVFAQAGYPVTMIDISKAALAKGRETIGKNLDRQIKKGALQAADKDAMLGAHHDHDALDAVQDATLVIEAATENRDLKVQDLRRARRQGASRRDPRHQHQLHFDHRDRRPHQAARRR